MQESITNPNLKKPFNLYITDAEINELKKEAEELSKLLKKKITISQTIRLKLKFSQEDFLG